MKCCSGMNKVKPGYGEGIAEQALYYLGRYEMRFGKYEASIPLPETP